MVAFRAMEDYKVETVPSVPINQVAVEKWKLTQQIARNQDKKAPQKKPQYNLHSRLACLLEKDNHISDYAAAVTQNMQTNSAEKPILRQIIKSRLANLKEPLFTKEAVIACCKRSDRFLRELQEVARV